MNSIKQISIAFVALLAFIVFPLSAVALEVGGIGINGSVTVGGQVNDYGNNQGKVGEYAEDSEINPRFGLTVKGNKDDFYFDFVGSYLDLDDLDLELGLDYRRIILGEFGYTGFRHQLDHDPLTNLEASFGGPKVTHEDFDIGRNYMINYTKVRSEVTTNLPFLEGTQLKMGYAEQNRKGYKQSLALNKCGSCHITSRRGKVNESTKDLTMGMEKKIGKRLTLLYEYLHREFTENASALNNFYDDALHPGKDKPLFDSRVQYENGDLPYGLVPDSQKDSHTFRLLAKLPKKSTLFTSYTHSDILNNHNDRGASLDSLTARFNNRWFNSLSMNLRLGYLTINNDDVFVDVNEPSSVAGMNKNYPWHDHKPGLAYNSFDPDFISKSAMSRDVFTLGFDGRYSVTTKTFFKFGYELETIDRGNYAVSGDDTKTTKNTASLFMNTRPFKKLKTRIGYTYKNTKNPFMNADGVYENIDVPPPSAANPWVSVQYWERQNARSATVSNQPTDVHEVLADVTWSIRNDLSLSANYKWITEENSQTDYSGWSQDTHMPSLTLQYAPMASLNFGLSYIYDWTKTETLVCIPVFDG